MSIRILIDGKPADVLREHLGDVRLARENSERLLALHKLILLRVSKVGGSSEQKRFADRATWIAHTPITQRLPHEAADIWYARLSAPLWTAITLLIEAERHWEHVDLGIDRAAFIGALVRLTAEVTTRHPIRSKVGRSKGPVPPRRAAGIVWRLAAQWREVFSIDPSASDGSIFVGICLAVLAASEVSGSKDVVRGATRNWAKNKSSKTFSRIIDEDRTMAEFIERLADLPGQG